MIQLDALFSKECAAFTNVAVPVNLVCKNDLTYLTLAKLILTKLSLAKLILAKLI
jgi:hypothetical protein